MDKIKNIILREYKNIFTDSGVIMLFVIAVGIYPIIYSLTYNNEIIKEINVAVVDENNSALSRKLTQMLDATDEVNVEFKNIDFKNAKQLFDEGKISGVFYIPKNFSTKIYKSEIAQVQVYADAAYLLIYKQIITAANYAIGTMGAQIEVSRKMAAGNMPEKAILNRNPLPVHSFPLYNVNGGYASFAMPAILLLILQQTLLLGIGLLGGTTKEKNEAPYLESIRLRHGGPMSIVIAKSLVYFSIYLLNAIFVLVIVFRIFNFPMRGNYFEIFVFITPFLFSVIYLGMTIALLFKSRESSLMILLFTTIPFLFLSGFTWPNAAMPMWQVYLSQLIPSTPAIKGFFALAQKGADFSDVFVHWKHLWILTIVYLTTASLFSVYKKRQ